MMSMTPGRAARRIEALLMRRYRPGLAGADVRLMPAAEIAFVATARICALQSFAPRMLAWRNRRFERAVAAMVRAEPPAAVYCCDSYALAAFDAAREVGARCILEQTIADQRTGLRLFREEAELHPEFAASLQLPHLQRFAGHSAAEPAAADRIVAGSEFVRSTLADNGVDPARISVVHYGADTVRFRPSARPPRHKLRVLFVGQIGQRKGIKYLLEAHRRLGRRDLELVVVGDPVGDGAGLARYRDIFTHVPGVPHAEVYRCFQSADLFVLPSLFEGSARVTYEALASGLPVITTPNAGSVVRDGVDGFIVPIRDVDALAENIARLADDQVLREQMGHSARARAEQFTWSRFRRGIARLVREELAIGGYAVRLGVAAAH
jgi:glycosyltransferase involved in cell wall biosynthesis